MHISNQFLLITVFALWNQSMFCVLIKKQIKDFFSIIPGSVDMDKVHYCERFLELLVDLEVGNN